MAKPVRRWRFGSAVELTLKLSDLSQQLEEEDEPCAVTLEGVSQAEGLRACMKMLNELKPPAAERLTALTLVDCAFDLATPAALAETLGRAVPEETTDQPPAANAAGAEPLSPDEDDVMDFDPFAEPPLDSSGPEASAHFPGEAAPSSSTSSGSLRKVTISRCLGAPSDAWSCLWRRLPTSLLSLDLSWNELSDRAVGALCGSLRHMAASCPPVLNLAGNRCKDMDRLLPLVADGRLRSLDLTSNQLNDKSAIQLHESLASPACRLERLMLSDNSRVSSSGLAQVTQTQVPGISGSLACLAVDGTSVCDKALPALLACLSGTSSSSSSSANASDPSDPSNPANASAAAGCSGTTPGLLQELWVHNTKLTPQAARSLLAAAASPASCCVRLLTDEGGERVDWRRPRSLEEPLDCLEALDAESALLDSLLLQTASGAGEEADGGGAEGGEDESRGASSYIPWTQVSAL